MLLLLAAACSPSSGPDPDQSGPIASPTPSPDGAPPQLEPAYGGVMQLANRGDPPAAFDTLRTSSIALHHVGGALFGPGSLVTRCRQNMYIVCPYLARTWVTNNEFTEWTFTINDDAVWHDGTPFTAEDAKFWLKLAAFDTPAGDKTRAPAYFKSDLGQIEEIEVLEGDRLRVSLKERFPFYLESLMNPRIKIAHPTHLMKERIEAGEVSLAPLDVELVGTGPFRLESYEKGSLLRVQRFDDYWEKGERGQPLPYLDGIEFIVMPDPSTMDAAIRAGRLDGGARGEGHYLSIERKQGYDNSLGDGVLYAEMQGGLFRLAFNVLKPGPWQDARVRQAISLWIDNQSAVPSALGGFGYLSPVLSPSNPFTSPDFATWPRFNPEQLEQNRAEAQRLMEEAGHAEGFTMGYLCRARLIARCEFIHAQLSGLNIDLNIQVVDEGEWNRGRVSLDYDSQPGAHFTPPLPEATESVFGVYSQNPDSYAKHEDETVTEMYNRLRLATTRAQRVAIWRELERYIVEEQAYVVPIAGTLQVVPYRSYVKGLVIPPEDGHTHTDFATVWLDRP